MSHGGSADSHRATMPGSVPREQATPQARPWQDRRRATAHPIGPRLPLLREGLRAPARQPPRLVAPVPQPEADPLPCGVGGSAPWGLRVLARADGARALCDPVLCRALRPPRAARPPLAGWSSRGEGGRLPTRPSSASTGTPAWRDGLARVSGVRGGWRGRPRQSARPRPSPRGGAWRRATRRTAGLPPFGHAGEDDAGLRPRTSGPPRTGAARQAASGRGRPGHRLLTEGVRTRLAKSPRTGLVARGRNGLPAQDAARSLRGGYRREAWLGGGSFSPFMTATASRNVFSETKSSLL